MKNEKKKNNIISFPGQLSTGEREVEAILFAAAEFMPAKLPNLVVTNSNVPLNFRFLLEEIEYKQGDDSIKQFFKLPVFGQ